MTRTVFPSVSPAQATLYEYVFVSPKAAVVGQFEHVIWKLSAASACSLNRPYFTKAETLSKFHKKDTMIAIPETEITRIPRQNFLVLMIFFISLTIIYPRQAVVNKKPRESCGIAGDIVYYRVRLRLDKLLFCKIWINYYTIQLTKLRVSGKLLLKIRKNKQKTYRGK